VSLSFVFNVICSQCNIKTNGSFVVKIYSILGVNVCLKLIEELEEILLQCTWVKAWFQVIEAL
jgi:hypothetical protein